MKVEHNSAKAERSGQTEHSIKLESLILAQSERLRRA